MRNSNTEQLVTLDEVIATTGGLPILVERAAEGKTVPWWDDRPAVPFSVAREIAVTVRAAQDDADRRQRELEAENEAKIQAVVDQGRRQAAEREAERPTRVPGGVAAFGAGYGQEWSGE